MLSIFLYKIALLYLLFEMSTANNIGYIYPKPSKPLSLLSDSIDDYINMRKEVIIAQALNNVAYGNSNPVTDVTQVNNYNFVGNKCSKCYCGLPNTNRIVGGMKIQFNKYPWIAQILSESFVFCGGTLINDLYIISAAHCVVDIDINLLKVRLLQLQRSDENAGIVRTIKQIYVHENYSPALMLNDIALLKMNRPISFSDSLRPICLPKQIDENFDNREAIVAGWGLLSDPGNVSYILNEANVPIISNERCKGTIYKDIIVETMICAGDVNTGGRDACQGDSGGPLSVGNQKFVLAGIVSFGFGCAQRNAPGVYTRVSKYLDWISSNTRDSCYCLK